MHIRSVIPVLATVFGCLSAPAVATELLFSADFESAPPYGFRGTYRLSDSYQITPAPGQGWKGSQAAHILERAHKRQYNLGWFSGTPRHWGPGDTMVVRFRIKFDPNWRWDGEGSMQNKMFDVGVGGNGESRFILHQEKPHPTTPCGLPQGDAPHWGSFSIKKGITETCTPPVRITYNRWYHVQLAVQASTGASTNDGSFRLWVNNNNADKPSSKRLKVDITSTYWNHGFGFGGFITDYPARDQGWVVDDLQISTEFDPHWYPDAAD